MDAFVETLFETLCARKDADPSTSYVASLYKKGDNAMLKKVGEEATEVVLAAKDNDNEALVYEVADLMFHTMVVLASRNISPQAIINELKRREGVSGIFEKQSRKE